MIAIKVKRLVNTEYKEFPFYFKLSLEQFINTKFCDFKTAMQSTKPPFKFPVDVNVTYVMRDFHADTSYFPANIPSGNYLLNAFFTYKKQPFVDLEALLILRNIIKW